MRLISTHHLDKDKLQWPCATCHSAGGKSQVTVRQGLSYD